MLLLCYYQSVVTVPWIHTLSREYCQSSRERTQKTLVNTSMTGWVSPAHSCSNNHHITVIAGNPGTVTRSHSHGTLTLMYHRWVHYRLFLVIWLTNSLLDSDIGNLTRYQSEDCSFDLWRSGTKIYVQFVKYLITQLSDQILLIFFSLKCQTIVSCQSDFPLSKRCQSLNCFLDSKCTQVTWSLTMRCRSVHCSVDHSVLCVFDKGVPKWILLFWSLVMGCLGIHCCLDILPCDVS